MVNIAVAGGSGNVANTLLRSVIASDKHHVTIFTRSSTTIPTTSPPNVTYQTIDYTNQAALVSALTGIEVCLSFLVAHLDTDCTVQKNLIRACIAAGVPRFAPSEWSIRSDNAIPEYGNKDIIANYLAELNSKEKVLEYCLFQPSIFLDYFAHPYPPTPPLFTWPFFIDFSTRHAILLEDGDIPINFTSAHDVSEILRRAIEDPRPWPVVGGIQGCRTTMASILELGKRLRGGEWTVERVTVEDIKRGDLKTEWVPKMDHQAIPVDYQEVYSRKFVITFLQAMIRGAWEVSGEWNERFPEYKFVEPEGLLGGIWGEKDGV
ncbi:NmrA-like family protein-like protein [Dendryphion nanum]|uniref:NmrA-like family protein-like protein n=1 Tax=Dendryphion nanum TaxID=256645 RepID=A0A9P9DTD9_9PLEO|nr:NmrA-like family protein-like protein [Dendryphion nanum]